MVWLKAKGLARNLLVHPAALLLGLVLVISGCGLSQASAMELNPSVEESSVQQSPARQLMANHHRNIAVYGTSPVAHELGHQYMVLFVAPSNQVQGVFYQVGSEYACFSGTTDAKGLTLSVVGPYEAVAYDHQIRYSATGYLANTQAEPAIQFVPVGFHPLATASPLDYSLFDACADQSTEKSSLETVSI